MEISKRNSYFITNCERIESLGDQFEGKSFLYSEELTISNKKIESYSLKKVSRIHLKDGKEELKQDRNTIRL